MENQGEYLRKDAMSADMGMEEHMQMMERRHLATLWCHFANLALGFWLLGSPFIFGYLNIAPDDLDLPRLALERALPAVGTRALLMTWSDVLGGLAIVTFAILSLRRVGWAQWANTGMGLWLMFAPLAFWTPSPASYGNGLLVGALVIAFSTLVPMMPGMSMSGMMQKASIPPGWDYCPSTWLQRLPIAVLALLGILLARYLAAYQLGHTANAWDPFFGTEPNGTETIITSAMSRAWPVSDAGVGVMAYMIELLMAVMGDARRWRTMPWMVAAFGVVVVPLGAVSIFFIIAQPIFIGTWCSLCLLQALAMLVMMPYALDELVAMGQFLTDAHRRGKPFWRTFFMGDAMEGAREGDQPEFSGGLARMILKGLYGVNLPWNLALLCLIGVWLMCTRLIYGTSGTMANSDHLMGSLLITVSVLAMAEVARPLRFLNLPIGLWLLVAPWLLSGATTAGSVGSLIAGGLIVALSLPLGPIRHQYAGWSRLLRFPLASARTPGADRETPPMAEGPRTVVICGATAGVGRATAQAFAQAGYRVALIARSEQGLAGTRAELQSAGARVLAIAADVADADAIEQAAARVETELGPIDVWVNSAMATVFGPVSRLSAAEFRRVTEVTYLGFVHGTLAALRHMRPRDRGTIVQVGSALAYRAIPLQSAYCAAKFAIRGFTDALRCELIHDGSRIRLSMVQLPAHNTPQFDWARNKMDKRPQPVPPIHQPEVAARAILRAADEAPRELWLGRATLQAILGTMLMPGLLDRMLARKAYEGQLTPEDEDPSRADNLFQPVEGLHRTAGRFADRARDEALAVSAAQVRAMLAAAVATVALIVIAVTAWLAG